jgi:polysaccharide pyruvyl transferase WcaK-like protein
MRIAIFACLYSANLGDGLLSLCLAKEMERASPGLSVTIQDLAGRKKYGDGVGRRKAALAFLGRLPRYARAPVMALFLGREVRRRLRPAWAEALANVDAAVLGGGNLLADADLNFPLKIAGVGAEIRSRGLPWAVFAVGVSAPWTKRGSRLFESALLSPEIKLVSVRDVRSKAIWDKELASKGAFEAEVCSDPAVLACDHFPARPRGPRDRLVLGLNITAPEELSLHSTLGLRGGRSLLEWWVELVALAMEAGYRVSLFTNGSLRDEEYLFRLQKRLEQAQIPRSDLVLVPRSGTPDVLAAVIADCDVVAGHRLHAHIPAFSYRIPSVGFAWDAKLRSFFEGVDRGEFVVDAGRVSPGEVLQCILRARSTGVSQQMWLAATDIARKGIAGLVATLEAGVMEAQSREEVVYV